MWIHHAGRGADLRELPTYGTQYRQSYSGHRLPVVPFHVHIWEEPRGIVFDCYPESGRIKLLGTDIPTMIAQVILVAG